jgi:hypothetical protein
MRFGHTYSLTMVRCCDKEQADEQVLLKSWPRCKNGQCYDILAPSLLAAAVCICAAGGSDTASSVHMFDEHVFTKPFIPPGNKHKLCNL